MPFPSSFFVLAGLADLDASLEVMTGNSAGFGWVPGDGVTITDIANGKKVTVDHFVLNNKSNGTWTIRLKDVRDEIGNFLDNNTSNSTIDHYEWEIDLY